MGSKKSDQLHLGRAGKVFNRGENTDDYIHEEVF